MNSVYSTTLKRIEEQGYLGLSDYALAEFGPGLRLAPATCMLWLVKGSYRGPRILLTHRTNR